MNAKLKRLHSPDVDDLVNFHAEQADNFCFLLQIMIGPEEVDGEESFDVEVCTPKWLLESMKPGEVVLGRRLIVVSEYSYIKIFDAIEAFLTTCTGKNWSEVSRKASGLGAWEFDGYEEETG